MTDRQTFDAVVLGAGSAGSAAAAFLAEAGLRTALVDARPLAQAGASWVNAVPLWFYDEAGIPRPRPPEAVSQGKALVMRSVHGPGSFRIDPAPAPTVDMALLVARLQDQARNAGAHLVGPVRDLRWRFEGDRPVEMRARHAPEDGPPTSLQWRASLFVDATGLQGFLRGQVPPLQQDCPMPGPGDLCAAIQEDCEVTDRAAAATFLERAGMVPGDVAGWVAVRGGYSTGMVHVHEGLDRAGLLIGVTGDGRHGTAREFLGAWKARFPFLGKGLRTGAGLIPVRRPLDRLVAPGVACIGDAACQVFPGHASGVGMGLLAARLLAEACGAAQDPGDLEVLWQYAVRFQRSHGPILGAFDVFRRMVWDLPEEDVQALTDLGFVGPSTTRMALSQRVALLDPRDLFHLGAGAIRRPDLAARLAITGPRMAAVAAIYRAYPGSPDREALARWSRTLAIAGGTVPDVTAGR